MAGPPGRSVVDRATARSIRAGRIAGIPICCRVFLVGNREQKLFPHFGEAGTAIFAVKQVEPNGHDRTLADHHSHAIALHHFTPAKVNGARE
jgi:hypothetical protein